MTSTDGPQCCEDDTLFIEDSADDTDYDVYCSGTLPKNKKPINHKYSKLNKKTSPQHKTQKPKRIKFIILCCMICSIIGIALTLFWLQYSGVLFKHQNTPTPRDDNQWMFANTTHAPTTVDPSGAPSIKPTIHPAEDPSTKPTINPTLNPTHIPITNPTIILTSDPTSIPTHIPATNPTLNPTSMPTTNPTLNPTSMPTTNHTLNPTSIPTSIPTHIPTTNPTIIPTANPTLIPIPNPTIIPTSDPTSIPTSIPTHTPTANPTIIPTLHPTSIPTNIPTLNPTHIPSATSSDIPTTNPTHVPTSTPSRAPTSDPTDNPTTITNNPTTNPTQSPITMISRSGNEIFDQGIIMNFPVDAFEDSILTITIGEATDALKDIFKDTTSAFRAMNIDNITGNAINFLVEHMPLDTPNITYTITIPIPVDLLQQCPNDYGFEIFTLMQQTELTTHNTRSIFVLFESHYDGDAVQQTLTTLLFPEMFKDFNADIILSCTPGVNIVRGARRRLLQDCIGAELICPIQSGRCHILNTFERSHYAIDYASENNAIISGANGVIERNSSTSLTYDNVVVTRNEDGSATVYGDLREIKVHKGQKVAKGDIIALSNPTHVHIEYIPNGEIYTTKKRINPNNCILPFIETEIPTKSPLVPPNTHSPTPAPVLYLRQGSITVRDSGRLADDAFATYIDGFKLCETEIGQLNTCAINFIRPGLHTLTLEVLVAPDKHGTFHVQLSNGWIFTDNTTSKDAIEDLNGFEPPEGYSVSWNFSVPVSNPHIP